jgi:hypothetical protein
VEVDLVEEVQLEWGPISDCFPFEEEGVEEVGEGQRLHRQAQVDLLG